MKVHDPIPGIAASTVCAAGPVEPRKSSDGRTGGLDALLVRRAKTYSPKPLPTVANALRLEVERELTSAMERNDREGFERTLTRWNPEWDSSTFRPGLTPLMQSLDKNSYFTKRLLQKGSSLQPFVALGPDTGITPVMYGIRTGASLSRLQLLIKAKPKLYDQTFSGETTLTTAIKAGRNDIVQLLFRRGAAWSIPYGFLEEGGDDMNAYMKIAKQYGQSAIEDTLRNPPNIDVDVWTQRTYGSEVIGSLGTDFTGMVGPATGQP